VIGWPYVVALVVILGVLDSIVFVIAVNRALMMGRLEILRNPPKPGALITMDERAQKLLRIKDFQEFRVEYPKERASDDESVSVGKRTPTNTERRRFECFRKLKDQHPDWTYERLADEVNVTRKLGEIVSGDTVRNTYRAVGAKWHKGDRRR